jgi:hypothetical protein
MRMYVRGHAPTTIAVSSYSAGPGFRLVAVGVAVKPLDTSQRARNLTDVFGCGWSARDLSNLLDVVRCADGGLNTTSARAGERRPGRDHRGDTGRLQQQAQSEGHRAGRTSASSPDQWINLGEEQQRPSLFLNTTPFLLRDVSTDPACSSGRFCAFRHPLRPFLLDGYLGPL